MSSLPLSRGGDRLGTTSVPGVPTGYPRDATWNPGGAAGTARCPPRGPAGTERDWRDSALLEHWVPTKPQPRQRQRTNWAGVPEGTASAGLKALGIRGIPLPGTGGSWGTAGLRPGLLPRSCQDSWIHVSLSRHLITRDSKTGAGSKNSSERN